MREVILVRTKGNSNMDAKLLLMLSFTLLATVVVLSRRINYLQSQIDSMRADISDQEFWTDDRFNDLEAHLPKDNAEDKAVADPELTIGPKTTKKKTTTT